IGKLIQQRLELLVPFGRVTGSLCLVQLLHQFLVRGRRAWPVVLILGLNSCDGDQARSEQGGHFSAQAGPHMHSPVLSLVRHQSHFTVVSVSSALSIKASPCFR